MVYSQTHDIHKCIWKIAHLAINNNYLLTHYFIYYLRFRIHLFLLVERCYTLNPHTCTTRDGHQLFEFIINDPEEKVIQKIKENPELSRVAMEFGMCLLIP